MISFDTQNQIDIQYWKGRRVRLEFLFDITLGESLGRRFQIQRWANQNGHGYFFNVSFYVFSLDISLDFLK